MLVLKSGPPSDCCPLLWFDIMELFPRRGLQCYRKVQLLPNLLWFIVLHILSALFSHGGPIDKGIQWGVSSGFCRLNKRLPRRSVLISQSPKQPTVMVTKESSEPEVGLELREAVRSNGFQIVSLPTVSAATSASTDIPLPVNLAIWERTGQPPLQQFKNSRSDTGARGFPRVILE